MEYSIVPIGPYVKRRLSRVFNLSFSISLFIDGAHRKLMDSPPASLAEVLSRSIPGPIRQGERFTKGMLGFGNWWSADTSLKLSDRLPLLSGRSMKKA
ncbi:hypothetical protein [Methylocaldum sp.]|uniref:hypothetical protein n=1 Tax=Methylocaldum sp. TaxID=1969727 RepID=UPI002D3CC1E4|nr:hypothetical protein [Methylocaldum sp.]HYE38121.1 hypothetical protein [Methylocaldum sp.]